MFCFRWCKYTTSAGEKQMLINLLLDSKNCPSRLFGLFLRTLLGTSLTVFLQACLHFLPVLQHSFPFFSHFFFWSHCSVFFSQLPHFFCGHCALRPMQNRAAAASVINFFMFVFFYCLYNRCRGVRHVSSQANVRRKQIIRVVLKHNNAV